MSRFVMRPATIDDDWTAAFVIVDTTTGQVVDTARNEARARLLVVRYSREAASGKAEAP